MTFARKDKNCPCCFCKAMLSKRHGDTAPAIGLDARVPARVRGRKTARNHNRDKDTQ